MKTQLIKGLIGIALICLSALSFSSPMPPTLPEACENGTSSSPGSADVVILVDSSSSMGSTWAAIVDASDSLEDAIKDKCGADANITLLAIDRVDPGSGAAAPTGFTSHEKYIIDNTGYSGPFETNDGGRAYEGEQGSKAIADVSNHFPWKEGACRSILYISDEWLDSYRNPGAPSLASIPIGVNAAKSNNVTVFTHLVGYRASNSVLADQYTQLAESTGGTSHIGDAPSKELYINLVSDAACKCGGGCNEEPPESCPKVGSADVVILVDSSGSMRSTWAAIIDASDSLEDAIKEKCGAEANITLLTLDTNNPGSRPFAPTGFTSHEQFIIDNTGYTGPFATDDGTWDGEQGSKAIADVSNHFPWKEGACRSILYISDEWLDSVGNGEAASSASIPTGVNAANSNNVTVFTHLVDSGGSSSASNPALATHYTQLATSTGGSSHIGDKPSKELYINLVSDAACKCGGDCNEEPPESCLVIEPKLECIVGKGWHVSLSNSSTSFNPTKLDVTSLTTGVTVVGSAPSWSLIGATPNSTVKLSANGVMKNGGSEKGTDLCCSTEVEIEIPDKDCPIIDEPEEACMLAETSPAGPFFDKGNNQWAFPLALTSLNGNNINEVKVTPVTAGVTLTNGPIYPVGTPSLSFTGVTLGQMAEFKFCAYDKNDMEEDKPFDCCKVNVKIKIRETQNPPKGHQPLEVVK